MGHFLCVARCEHDGCQPDNTTLLKIASMPIRFRSPICHQLSRVSPPATGRIGIT